MRRVRSEENVADLGTKTLSKAVIARHCLTLGYVNMNEGNVWSECQVVAMVWDFVSAVSSQQQAAGDDVQRTASRDPQQQKQPQHPQQRQQAGQEGLVLWIPTNPNDAMNRWVDNHNAMDLMQGNCDDCDAVLESTSETSDKEDTYERPGENISITSAEHFRCTEFTTNLYRTS